MKRLTLALRQRCRASISTQSLLVLAACVLWPAAQAAEGITPAKWFYEIDGDYESRMLEVDDDREALDVGDGGVVTQGAHQGSCNQWAHTTDRPYMGTRAYTTQCFYAPEITIRSEQHFVQGLRPGADTKRSVSMAVRLSGPTIPTKPGGAWIAQLHNENLTIPFILEFVREPVAKLDEGIPEPGYYLHAGGRYELPKLTRDSINLGRVSPNTWVRLLIQLDLGKGDGAACPGSTTDDASWSVQLMDNATGLWREPVRSTFQVGNRYDRTNCPTSDHFNTNFKLGQYYVTATNRVDFDNITYGKRWINITKNHLVGYHKCVLRMDFEEPRIPGLVNRVADRSYTRNGGTAGDPTKDYDNDGLIVGREVTRIDEGVKGRALHFPGKRDNFVRVPIGPNAVDDFDVGNYMTVSAWFRTGETPPDNKGLVMIDEFSDTWKLLLYMRGNGMAFGVRHRVDPGQPGAYSRLDHVFPMAQYANGQWHLVTGTYNRFAHDGKRIKLYIDGEKVMEGEGHDLPVLRGENQLVVGKYSVNGFFEGDIDDVGLFNYTMTGAQVRNLWRERMERVVP